MSSQLVIIGKYTLDVNKIVVTAMQASGSMVVHMGEKLDAHLQPAEAAKLNAYLEEVGVIL